MQLSNLLLQRILPLLLLLRLLRQCLYPLLQRLLLLFPSQSAIASSRRSSAAIAAALLLLLFPAVVAALWLLPLLLPFCCGCSGCCCRRSRLAWLQQQQQKGCSVCGRCSKLLFPRWESCLLLEQLLTGEAHPAYSVVAGVAGAAAVGVRLLLQLLRFATVRGGGWSLPACEDCDDGARWDDVGGGSCG